MKRLMIALAGSAAALAIAAPAAQAHDLTCSTDPTSHRIAVEKKYKRLKVDDFLGSFCVQVKKNRIRYIARRSAHSAYYQDVSKLSETCFGPGCIFYSVARYRITKVHVVSYPEPH
jgi:hypothetical protein